MKIAVSGATGLVGSALVPFLKSQNHSVVELSRKRHKDTDTVFWDPTDPNCDLNRIDGFDAVIHLAGESIMGFRWTEEKKRKIRGSRVFGTENLCSSLKKLPTPPKAFICSSATGIYGDRKNSELTEQSESGTGFLADVAREWERAAETISDGDTIVTNVRTGVVLSPKGGMLRQILLPFRLGFGSVLGDGTQWMSWISLSDLVQVFYAAANAAAQGDRSWAGPVNAVSPTPIQNKEFSETLAKVLHRPLFLRAPAWTLKLIMGQMAEEVALASQKVLPKKLSLLDFQFKDANLEETLKTLLQ